MKSRATQIRETVALRDPWERCLESINQIEGVMGSLLVTRDGLSVLNQCSRLRRPEVVAAMGAAVLAASETVAAEFSLDRNARFHMQAGHHTVIGVGATDTLLVLALLGPTVDANEATAEVERLTAIAAQANPG